VKPIDAAKSIDAAKQRPDSSGVTIQRDAGLDAIVAMSVDSFVQPIDAPVKLEPGKILVVSDTWCELSIDKVRRGRIQGRGSFDVDPGHHVVHCNQPGINDVGWTDEVDVQPGKSATAEGSMLESVQVRFDFDAKIGDDSFTKGQVAKIKPGRKNVIVDGMSLWVDIPRFACRLRFDGGKLVCDP
jgi:hypothetical protein